MVSMENVIGKSVPLLKKNGDGTINVLSDCEFNLKLFELNATASAILEAADGTRDIKDIVETLYGKLTGRKPSIKTVELQTIAFLNELIEKKLVKVVK
ncbi:PqqD family protein [archaeon]|nr:PqqD family protein [archaeon]